MSGASDKFKIEYYRFQVAAWRVLGAMDVSNGNYLGLATIMNIFALLLVPMLIQSYFSFKKPLENITSINLTIMALSTVLKFAMYVRKLPKLIEMKRVIAKLDARVTGEEQVRSHQQMTKQMHRISLFFVATFSSIMVTTAVSFLFVSERSLPFPLWFPFDWKHSTAAYVAVVLLQEIGIFCLGVQNFADDSFPPLALYFIAKQCQLLILRISCIGYGLGTLKANEEELVNCIKDQNNLYRLLDLTRSLITWPVMIQFIVVAVNMGLTMFCLVFYVESVRDHLFYLMIVYGIIMQAYPLCYYGTMATDSFSDLHYAVFCSNWIYQSKGYRSSMLIMSERTKARQEFRAGGIVPIHLSTFTALCRSAYSFYTLMHDIT